MVLIVAACRVPDGREFTYAYEVEDEYADNQLFWWTEGNAGCDCNRGLFAFRSAGIALAPLDADGEPDVPCGDTIKLLALTIGGHPMDLSDFQK